MKALTLAAVLAAAGCSSRTATPPRASVVASDPALDRKIAYYEQKVTEKPKLYPVWVQLGDAYLDKARTTSDVSYLAKAHAAADRSLAIQETYEAFHLKARLYGHTHHFDEALVWARKAEASTIFGPDWMIRALEVEMLVGAGRIDEARALLPAEGQPIDEFYVATALARIEKAQGLLDNAAKHYLRAAELAQLQHVTKLVAWSEAMAGGMLLDGGNFTAALPHLDRSKQLGGCAEEQIHRAELLAHTGKQREALAVYEGYLAKTPDPVVHHAAWKLARSIGDDAAARAHFDAARAGYKKVVDAGEVFTLGAFAQLILDSNGDAREALLLAEQNFKYKRDQEAEQTLAEAKRRVGGATSQ
jgi:tetratricopeptide (TPR) repeat protein